MRRAAALLVALLLAAPAAAEPDCGDNGGFFGRIFRAQYDRPEIPVVYVEVKDVNAACHLLDARYPRRRDPSFRYEECADLGLRVDGRNGYVYVPEGATPYTRRLRAHGACHIRYGHWHEEQL